MEEEGGEGGREQDLVEGGPHKKVKEVGKFAPVQLAHKGLGGSCHFTACSIVARQDSGLERGGGGGMTRCWHV